MPGPGGGSSREKRAREEPESGTAGIVKGQRQRTAEVRLLPCEDLDRCIWLFLRAMIGMRPSFWR